MTAESRDELVAAALELMQRVFNAPIRMILLPRIDSGGPLSAHAGLRGLHFDQYLQSWQAHDPVRRAALQSRTCVRDVDVTAQVASCAFRAGFAQRIGADSYLVAPLYGHDGGIAGAVHLWRYAGQAAFSSADAQQAMVFAAFLSVMLVRSRQAGVQGAPRCALAPREHQVALLAANGHSNKDIARELGVASETVKQTLRRVYRKISVAGRTQLALHYARAGVL